MRLLGRLTIFIFVIIFLFTGCRYQVVELKKGLHLPIRYENVRSIIVKDFAHLEREDIPGASGLRVLSEVELKQFISHLNSSLTVEVVSLTNKKAGLPPMDVTVELKDSEMLQINENTKYTIIIATQDTLYTLYQPELSRYICKIEGADDLYNGLTEVISID